MIDFLPACVCLAYSFILMMKEVLSSETSLNIYQIMRPNIPEDITFLVLIQLLKYLGIFPIILIALHTKYNKLLPAALHTMCSKLLPFRGRQRGYVTGTPLFLRNN
jgi:hypothetical protein